MPYVLHLRPELSAFRDPDNRAPSLRHHRRPRQLPIHHLQREKTQDHPDTQVHPADALSVSKSPRSVCPADRGPSRVAQAGHWILCRYSVSLDRLPRNASRSARMLTQTASSATSVWATLGYACALGAALEPPRYATCWLSGASASATCRAGLGLHGSVDGRAVAG